MKSNVPTSLYKGHNINLIKKMIPTINRINPLNY